MKTMKAVALILTAGFFFNSNGTSSAQARKDSVVAVVAEANGLPLVPSDKLPRHGTFWLVMNEGSFLLPMPFLSYDPKTTPIFSLGAAGQFLVDATDGILPQPTKRQALRGVTSATLVKAQIKAIQDLIAQVQDAQLNTELGALPGMGGEMMLMGMGPMGYSADDFWIEILSVDLTNHNASLRLHGTVDTNQYQLLYTNNLIVPGTEWTLGEIKPGDSGTNQTDYPNVPISTNSQMFFRAHQANPIVSIVSVVPDAVEPNTATSEPGQAGLFYVGAVNATNDLVVYYRVSGTASNGVDYTNLSGTVTVPISTGYAEIDVAPVQDNLDEGSESVKLTLIQTNSYLIDPGADSASGQIWDASATVSLDAPSPNAYEPNGPPGIPALAASFSIYRSDLRGIYTNSLTVFYQVTGTASNGVDYVSLSGSLTFLAGITATNFDVTPLGDNLLEGAETVTLTLIPTNTYLIDTNTSSRTATLWDSSTTVSISTVFPGLAIESNGPPGIAAQAGSFQVSRTDIRPTGAEYPEMDVFYRVSGTASNGLDYVLSGTLHFATNILSTNLDVVPLADNFLEGPESVTVTLIPTNGYYVNTNSASASLIIIDSSTTNSISVVSPGIAIEQDGPPGVPAQKGSFRISRSDTRLKYPDLDVYYRVSGTASNGLDYALSGILHFTTNSVSTNLDVVPFADNIIEGSETVTVTLIPTNGYYVHVSSNSSTLTIVDSSTTVSIALSNSPAIEPDGPPGVAGQSGAFRISRSDSRSKYPDLDVYYRVSGTASNGLDYVLSGILHFATNSLVTNLDVTPLADSVVEGAETVTVTLIATNGYYVNTNSASATLTIIDSTTTISVYPGADAAEPNPFGAVGGQSGYFQFIRNDTRFQYLDLVVYYRMTGTASNGVDYSILVGSFTFPAGQNSANVNVQPIPDYLVEGDESIILTLTATNGYYVDTNHSAAAITIQDAAALVQVVTNINAPIGIDYHSPSNSLIVSYNYDSSVGGGPYNFARIYTNIVFTNSAVVTNVVVTNWSGVNGLANEVKLATVKITQSGFTNGDLYYANNTAPGRVGWLSANGTVWNTNFMILTNDTHIHGGLYVDQTGVFSNNLIVVTGGGGGNGGGVWMINSSNTAKLLVNLTNVHLEGVVTLPNNTNQWGPWAGKIITGSEDLHTIYTIATNGIVTTNFLGINPEDFDIIPANQNLYGCDPDRSAIMKLSSIYLTNFVGDLMVTQAGESGLPRLFIVHWEGTNFVTTSLTYRRLDGSLGHFEHVTFAPLDIPPPTQ